MSIGARARTFIGEAVRAAAQAAREARGEVAHTRGPQAGQTQVVTRHTLSGQPLERHYMSKCWADFVAPGPQPTGGARSNPDHPSRKHDVKVPERAFTPSADVVSAPRGSERRRVRREQARAER